MANFSISVITDRDDNPVVPGAKSVTVNQIINALAGIIGGAFPGTIHAAGNAARAKGTVTIGGSATGTLTATINGVATNVTYATSATNSAALLAAAINASTNPLVAGHVKATSAAGVVTIEAVTPGIAGNAITLAGSGTGVTASGARLTGGTQVSATFEG